MLKQPEWGVQNGPIAKNGVLPPTNLFFWKFDVSIRTSYKELINVPTTLTSIRYTVQMSYFF